MTSTFGIAGEIDRPSAEADFMRVVESGTVKEDNHETNNRVDDAGAGAVLMANSRLG